MTTANSETPAGNPKRKRWLLILLAVIVLATLASVAWEFFYGRWHEDTDDAYINGNVVQITPQIVGTVVSIGADDGDLVRKGQELVRFDPSDADIALQRAEANLAHTVRQVRGLFSNVDGYRAEVATRKVALAKAEADYKRRKNLADDGAISQEELAHARDALDSAKASLTSSEQQLNTNRALVDDTQITSHPDVKAAAAQLRQAYLDDARSTIVAPVTGYVAKRSVQVGQRVQPGTALMAVVPLDQIWIDANFKETQLKHMRIGQPVEIRSDRRALQRHRRQPRRGNRQRVLPAAGAERHRQLDQDRPAGAGAHPYRSARIAEASAAHRPVDGRQGRPARPERPGPGPAATARSAVLHRCLPAATGLGRQADRTPDRSQPRRRPRQDRPALSPPA